MLVRVHLFALARDLAGASIVEVPLSDAATVADLRRELATRTPALAPILTRSMIALNHEFARDADIVPADAEIACIPPVSGG